MKHQRCDVGEGIPRSARGATRDNRHLRSRRPPSRNPHKQRRNPPRLRVEPLLPPARDRVRVQPVPHRMPPLGIPSLTARSQVQRGAQG